MAKGKKRSLAVRAVALLFALALAALAARLWLGTTPRETSASQAAHEGAGGASESNGADVADDVATAPPLHEPYTAEERETLRDLVRETQGETP